MPSHCSAQALQVPVCASFCRLLHLQSVLQPALSPAASTGSSSCVADASYAPVCGKDGQTYGNAAVAACANIPVDYQGKCVPCSEDGNKTDSSLCQNSMFTPVCAHGWTWGSACLAASGGKGCPVLGVCQYSANVSAANSGSDFTPAPLFQSVYGVAQASQNMNLPPTKGYGQAYGEALTKGLLYYRAAQSGVLDYAYLAWRGDSCQDCTGPAGEDVSGGFYSSGGGRVTKFGSPSSWMMTPLAWSLLASPAGYQRAGKLEEARIMLKWGADHLLNCWNAQAQTFVAVIGDDIADQAYYGPPEEWQQYNSRPSFAITAQQPGSEVTGEAAAALAAAYLVLNDTRYLQAAEQLYAFSVTTNTSIANSTSTDILNTTKPSLAWHQLEWPMEPGKFMDELAWAASWLYYATKNTTYLIDARSYFLLGCNGTYPYELTIQNRAPAVFVLLAQLDPNPPFNASTYFAQASSFFTPYLLQYYTHTPAGLAYLQEWGGLRPAMSAAFLALMHAQNPQAASLAPVLFNYAQYQVNYVLGNITGLSYMAGYGANPPTFLYHKSSYNSYIIFPLRNQTMWVGQDAGPIYNISGPIYQPTAKLDFEGGAEPQRFIPYGALYANPLQNDGRVTGRKDRQYTEPTGEGHSTFVGALAALAAYYQDTQPYDAKKLDLGWTHSNVTRTSKSRPNV